MRYPMVRTMEGCSFLATYDKVPKTRDEYVEELEKQGDAVRMAPSELLEAEMAPLRALGRCRVVVSGPASFNAAVAEMLETQCRLAPDAITILDGGGNARESKK